jgi:hypothetical protein
VGEVVAALPPSSSQRKCTCIDIRDEESVKSLLGLPEGYKAVSIIAIGHPTRPHKPRPRLAINELVFSEQWGEAYYEEQQ